VAHNEDYWARIKRFSKRIVPLSRELYFFKVSVTNFVLHALKKSRFKRCIVRQLGVAIFHG
jgi:hypothetical protein